MSCTMYCTNTMANTMAGTMAGAMAGTIKGHNKMSVLNTLYPPVCAKCNVAFFMEFYPGISC